MEKGDNKILNFLKSKMTIIIVLVAVIISIVVCSLLYYFLTLKEAIWDEEEKGRPSEYTNNVKISVDSDDGIIIDKEELVKEALKDLGYKDKDIKEFEDKDIIEKLKLEKKLGRKISSLDDVTAAELMWCTNDIYSKYLSKVDELEKLLNAEVITQYPKVKDSKDILDGIIEFERHDTSGGIKKLKYLKKSKFDALVETNDTDIVNYFTLDENENAVFGVIDVTTEEFSSNDDSETASSYCENVKDGESKSVIYAASTVTVDYKSAVSKYTMPFEYLWDLLIVSKDKDFVLELADLVEDSEITISLYDNITTTVNEEVFTYKKETKTVANTYVKNVNNGSLIDTYPSAPSYSTDSKEYTIKHQITYESDNFTYDLTKANVWIIDYSKEYDYKAKKETSTETNTVDLEDTEYVSLGSTSGIPEVNEETGISTTVIYNNSIHNVERKRTNNSTVYTQEYVAKTPKSKYKVEKDDKNPNFVNILCKKEHEAAKRLLSDKQKGGAPHWLFEILESGEKTSNMVDLTKYLLYRVTSINFGKKDFNFEEYENIEFNDVNSIDAGGTAFEQFIAYLHAWEGGASQDGEYYVVQSDGSNGGSAVGHGVDIGAHGAELRAAGYNTSIGSKIPVDVVDAIEKRVINAQLADIKSKTKGLDLKEYQIYALLTRQYNTGHFPSEFVKEYKDYWDSEKDDKYGEKGSVDYNHRLYAKLLSRPITSKGEVLNGLINRRKSEWLLFQTGYFDRGVNGYCSTDSVESGTIGAILSKAKEIHECLEKNKASWSITGLPTYEEIRNSRFACCANYVSAVLIDAGCINKSEYTPGAAKLETILAGKSSFKKIINFSDLKTGDIVFMTRENSTSGTGHVQIFAGNSKWYNAGSTNSLQSSSPKTSSDSYVKSRFICAYRYVK